MKNKMGLLLIISGILYISAVIIGGFLVPDYNHIYNAISELSEVGKSKVLIVEIFFGIYNILIIIYSALSILYKKNKGSKLLLTVYIILGLTGLSGILMGIFPQEARGGDLTIVGIMHFILAGIAAFSTLLCILLTAIYYKKNKQYKKYTIYSFISFIIIFLSGFSNVILMNNNIDNYFGLVERITIGTFIIWLITTGIKDMKENDM
jgi:hypothetical membrane protein